MAGWPKAHAFGLDLYSACLSFHGRISLSGPTEHVTDIDPSMWVSCAAEPLVPNGTLPLGNATQLDYVDWNSHPFRVSTETGPKGPVYSFSRCSRGLIIHATHAAHAAAWHSGHSRLFLRVLGDHGPRRHQLARH